MVEKLPMELERDSLLECEKIEQDATDDPLAAEASEAREDGRKKGSPPEVSLVADDTRAKGELGMGSGGVGVGHRDDDEALAVAGAAKDGT